MDRVVRIPVKTAGAAAERTLSPTPEASVPPEPAAIARPAQDTTSGETVRHNGEVDWRDLALRQQADMDNFRRRQQRLAQEQVASERDRLLRSFLQVVDDLERALAAPADRGGQLRQGIELTHRSALHLMRSEGVEPISAQGQPFDPVWHEAIATAHADSTAALPGTVLQVVEPGYRLGPNLLRPAKVIVAA